MRQPECLATLMDLGLIEEVVRPLMSGKEAQVYLVVSGGELRVAKVYKTSQNRNFRQRAEYTEGRAVRNTRTQRAMSKRSVYGRAQDEASWRSAEVERIYQLSAAGVRVPRPYHFVDGSLVMELVRDADGNPAPRLADVAISPPEAGGVFTTLLASVVKMLCAGVVHGDLSEFNVLMGHDGPVLIDFPQAVDPAHNNNARKLLIRDVDNLSKFLGGSAPGRRRPYGQEIWELYERNLLTPETQLTGRWAPPARKADDAAVLREIEDVAEEAQRQRAAQGFVPARRRRRRPRRPPAAQTTSVEAKPAPGADTAARRPGAAGEGAGVAPGPAADSAPARPRGRRSRRRRTGNAVSTAG